VKTFVALVLALAAFTSAASAGGPVELTDAQMDEVTAGAVNGARGHFLGDYMGLERGSSRVATYTEGTVAARAFAAYDYQFRNSD
jgi:hypothetical protein